MTSDRYPANWFLRPQNLFKTLLDQKAYTAIIQLHKIIFIKKKKQWDRYKISYGH